MAKTNPKEVQQYVIIGVGLLVVATAFGSINKILYALGLKDSPDTKDLDTETTDPGSFWSQNFYLNAPAGSMILSSAAAEEYIALLVKAFGAFNDDEDLAIGVFKKLRTQSQASFLVWYFQKKYNSDLLTWLRGGSWPDDRLSDAAVNEITRYIKSLPKYKVQ